jgi:uncharacterized protein
MLDVVPGDPDDSQIVEAAIAGGCETIVTGDKDLLRMGEFGGIKMVRVRDYLERRQGK